jgi:glycosyltransferase involved in cell wall biosynthesis
MRAGSGTARPPVAMIAWSVISERSEDIARALGGESRCFYDLSVVNRRLVPLRYLLSGVRTLLYLARRRPRAVVVTNPPIAPGLIAFLYGRLFGATLVLDSHPSSFDPRMHAELARQLPAHRWLTRRAAATLVTGAALAGKVQSWGGMPIEFHEAPPNWRLPLPRNVGPRPRVLTIGVFAADEPVAEVLEAAKQLPEYTFAITGDVRRCPSGVRATAPPNVEFTGFLKDADYRRALERADAVLSLTCRPDAASRASYEAVYASRPLVTSDFPLSRELFPYAVHVRNEPDAIAAGVRTAIERQCQLTGTAAAALELQNQRVERQLARLREVLGLESKPASADAADALPRSASPAGSA